MVGLGSIKKNDKKIQYAPLLENIFFKHTAFISVPMFWSNGYCLFVYNNATIHHHYYYIFLFSETHLLRVLRTSDYLDIKGDQWKRRSLTEEDAFRELVHWCCCCCAPRSWLCRSLHSAHHVQHFCKLASTLLLLRVRAPVHSMHCRVQFFYFYPILPSSSSFSFYCCCNGCNPASPHATRAQRRLSYA